MNRQALTVNAGIEIPEPAENPLAVVIDEKLDDMEKHILRNTGGADAVATMICVNVLEAGVITRGKLVRRVTEQLTPVEAYLKSDQAYRRGLETDRSLEKSVDLWLTTIDSYHRPFCQETRYESSQASNGNIDRVKYRFSGITKRKLEYSLDKPEVKKFIDVVMKANELWNAM